MGFRLLASFQPQSSSDMELLPVKTISSHFSQVKDANIGDFRAVFGWEDDPHRRNESHRSTARYGRTNLHRFRPVRGTQQWRVRQIRDWEIVFDAAAIEFKR